MPLSREARKRKVEYNIKRNRELCKKFSTNLPKEEYNEICEYLKVVGMNKAEFIRWAYSKLREN